MKYNPVLPSSLLGIQNDNTSGFFRHEFNNFSLKNGVVIESYEIDHKDNICKVLPEYDVVVVEQDDNRGATATTYRHCISTDGFGGVSDFFEFKLRKPSNKEFKNKLDPITQNGSLVLLLCLDAIGDKGIIIGSLCHPKRKTTLTKENGQHLEGEYNGINFKINKDGELIITYKSKTDNDGKYGNSSAGGSFVKLEKDGSIVVDDNKGNKVKIDKSNNEIKVDANGGILKLKNGKVALGTSNKEVLDIVVKLLNKLDENKQTFVSTVVGPGILNPAIVAAINTAKSDINSIKGSI